MSCSKLNLYILFTFLEFIRFILLKIFISSIYLSSLSKTRLSHSYLSRINLFSSYSSFLSISLLVFSCSCVSFFTLKIYSIFQFPEGLYHSLLVGYCHLSTVYLQTFIICRIPPD